MNMLHNVDDRAFRVSVRIQAALAAIYQLMGPRHTWISWMRDSIKWEQYYSSQLNMDVLHFEDLHVEDLAVIAPEYIALSLPLPELGEPDWWWKSPHTFREFERYISTSAVTLSIRYKHIQRARCNRLEVELNEAEEKTIVSDDIPSPGPSKCSNLEGKARAVTPNPKVALKELEGPKVCETCRSCGLEYVWPAVDESNPNEKHACTRCTSQKMCCYITAIGILEVKEVMKKLVMKLVIHEQEKVQLLSSVSILQATVAQMSLKLPSGP
ncbi:hypothetical protein EV363DRAFT_1296684 [Boletus edulis]|nr:hypothetical protein EV363DRAFT_1296684 [Boletus edulis]